MGDVIQASFAPPVQTAVGGAFCFSCNHTWEAVAPTGTVDLECPSCHRLTGHFKFGFYPNEDEMVRQCGCGNQLFYMTRQGHMCANCGMYQRYD